MLTYKDISEDKVQIFLQKVRAMKDDNQRCVLVLFDGAGLMRLGLEQTGHICVGVELSPIAHHLSTAVGSGNCILGNALDFEEYIPLFDVVHASPPCQKRSAAAAPHLSLIHI